MKAIYVLGLIISFGAASFSYSKYVVSIQNNVLVTMATPMLDDVMSNKYEDLLENCPNKKIILSELTSKQNNIFFLQKSTLMAVSNEKNIMLVQVWLWSIMVVLFSIIVVRELNGSKSKDKIF